MLHYAETELLPLKRNKGCWQQTKKRNIGMMVSNFFSPLPINQSYFVWFLNYNLIFLAIFTEFSEGSHPIVDI